MPIQNLGFDLFCPFWELRLFVSYLLSFSLAASFTVYRVQVFGGYSIAIDGCGPLFFLEKKRQHGWYIRQTVLFELSPLFPPMNNNLGEWSSANHLASWKPIISFIEMVVPRVSDGRGMTQSISWASTPSTRSITQNEYALFLMIWIIKWYSNDMP